MRFFRFMAITVLLLACVVLGSACAGAKGEEGLQGPKGDTGTAGVGVQSIVNNGNGTFTVKLTNGTTYTTDNLTGPTGAKGDTGATGAQGIQGVPGPNMIVAMGNIKQDLTILQGYQVDNVTWDAGQLWYDIALTGIDFNNSNYVTVVTPVFPGGGASYNSAGGHLIVTVLNDVGNRVQYGFSFMVLDTTP
jgi:hypothetical protein